MTLNALKAVALAAALPVAAFAATDSLYNLNVVAQTGNDPALAAALQALISPPIQVTDGGGPAALNGSFVDLGAINITTTYQGRVIFLNNAAGFNNTVGMLTNSGADFGVGDPDAVLFGFSGTDASVNIDGAPFTLPGASVDLLFTAGDSIRFFALNNAKRPGGTNSNGDAAGQFGDVWYGNPSDNVDGQRHIVAFQPVNSPFLILALDDQFDGTADFDFNDVLFAVDLGPNVPEPATYVLFLSFLAAGIFFWRRQKLALG